MLLLILLVCSYAQDEQNDDHKDKVVLDEDIMKEWQQHMEDFQPDDLIAFNIPKGGVETLEEFVDKPTKVRGAFFLSVYSKQKVDFSILSPEGDLLVSRASKKESLFSINVTTRGDYKFIFSNKNVFFFLQLIQSQQQQGNDDIQITFALDVHNSTQDHLQHHDLDPVTQKVIQIQEKLQESYFETKFSFQRKESGFEQLSQTHTKLLSFTIVETLVILGVSIWQVYYIKNILDNRRVI